MYVTYAVIIFLVIYFAYLAARRKKLEKQVELFNRLLYVEKSPQKYIDEVDKLILKYQSEKEKHINYIQKTTGLLYAGRFDQALRILNEDVKKIPPNWQVIFYHNMLLSLYFKGDIDKANKILDEVKATLDFHYKKDYNKVTIELIYAISQYYNDRIDECKDFFNMLIDVTHNEYRIAMGYYFSGKILENEGKIEEGQDYLEKAKEFGQGSFIEYL